MNKIFGGPGGRLDDIADSFIAQQGIPLIKLLLMRIKLFLFLLVHGLLAEGQTSINAELLKGSWRTSWITCPNVVNRQQKVDKK
jgi:hypothetical protein